MRNSVSPTLDGAFGLRHTRGVTVEVEKGFGDPRSSAKSNSSEVSKRCGFSCITALSSRWSSQMRLTTLWRFRDAELLW